MNNFATRMGGAALASALAFTGLGLLASPASAVEPTGGCWVYTVTGGAAIEAAPASDISSTLAPWTDSAAAPAGPADYTLTTSGGTAVGSTRNISLTFNKGPKNGGPPASGTAYYFFKVNGVNLPPIGKAFSAAAASVIPGDTIVGSFKVAATGSTAVTFRKVIYDIPSFTTRVACNGQTAEADSPGANPATTPLDTNVVSDPFTATPGTIAVTQAGKVKGKTIVGKTLKAKNPAASPAPSGITYQWLRNGKNIKKATAAKYTLVAKDKGKTISVKMLLTHANYNPLTVTYAAKNKVTES